MIGALLNHLWQSAVFAALAGILTLTLRKNPANARYGLWLAASLKFLLPFSLLVMVGSQVTWRALPDRRLRGWPRVSSTSANRLSRRRSRRRWQYPRDRA